MSVGAQRRALSRTSATLGPVPFLCRVRPLVSPHEGSSSDWRGYNDIDDDSDLQFFEMIKNKIVSSIIVPENCAYVIVLLFYKLVREVTELKQ